MYIFVDMYIVKLVVFSITNSENNFYNKIMAVPDKSAPCWNDFKKNHEMKVQISD
jgi:hypothetical protein